MEDLLTIEQVSNIIGVSVHTLRKWRCEDKGPKSLKRAGRVKYRPVDIHQWLDEQDEVTSRGGIRRTVGTYQDGFVE
jgi:predicted site-specific integrase-resolvase